MNTQSKTGQNLEDQLREHYAAKAGEMHLPDATLDDVLARADVPVTAVTSGSTRRGWIAGSVAAALVGGAVIGAGIVSFARDNERPAARPTVLSETAPTEPTEVASRPGPCATSEVPADFDELGIQNDARVANLLLPARVPDGYCSLDHNVTTINGLSGGEYTVWTDCGECAQPTAAIAKIVTGEPIATTVERGDFDTMEVDGHAATYFPPSDTNALGRLYIDLGEAYIAIIGWGLDADGFIAAAEESLDDDDTVANEMPGMRLVYEGGLDGYDPGLIPYASTLDVWYVGDADIRSWLRYSVLDYQTVPPLEAYAWVQPNPTFTAVDGVRRVTFPAAPYDVGGETTIVITQVDDNTQVLWSSTGETPIPADELAAIPLTPAPVEDPRWLEIAWESGMSEAVG